MTLAVNRDGTSKKKILISSILFMGLGHILYLKQYVKGAFFALIEILVLVFSPQIISKIIGIITLGDPHPELPIFERDNSMFMLIDGVMMLAVVLIFAALYVISVKSALSSYRNYCIFGTFESNKKAVSSLGNKAFPIAGLAPLVLIVLFFVVVPLIFSACVAFTNYSSPEHITPKNIVDWVGFDNFVTLFGGNASWTSALGSVALWTLVWAVLATFTCYAGGLIMAVVMTESKMKVTPLFRSIFILPYAVPSVVSMLVWQYLLNGSFGTVSRTLQAIGILAQGETIPWLSDAFLAKFSCVMVNLWAGFPYFMLLALGTMTSISQDIYEAARIDGASKWQVFRRITLPIVLYQTAPLIIMSFTHNINNFGAIFFLTGGKPAVADTVVTNAGGTDIIVSWIYKLTVNLQAYHYAAVLAVCIFVILAPIAIFNFRRTKSFKEGEL